MAGQAHGTLQHDLGVPAAEPFGQIAGLWWVEGIMLLGYWQDVTAGSSRSVPAV